MAGSTRLHIIRSYFGWSKIAILIFHWHLNDMWAHLSFSGRYESLSKNYNGWEELVPWFMYVLYGVFFRG